MRISTRGRYALRILVDMARHRSDGYIALKTVAERQGISKKYLDQIAIHLNRAGYLQAARGPKGGYRLAGPPERYTVGDILRATEGDMSPLACLGDAESCGRHADCLVRPVWQGLEDAMARYLDGVTLRDIIERGKV